MWFLIFLSIVLLDFCLLPAGSKGVWDLIIEARAIFDRSHPLDWL